MATLTNRRITLIGGAGFIGHNLALALAKEGAEVQVIDSLQVNNLLSFTGVGENHASRELYLKIIHERLELLHQAGIALHIQDARDYHALSRLITQTKPQVLIHLAAVAHAGKSNKDPYSTFDHSLRTLENALDACRDRIEHFIYFSSSMVYGNFKNGLATEESVCEPVGIYGALKFAGEKIVIAYHQVFGLPYTILRPSALYGERCVSRRVGQIFIENAMRGLKTDINGNGMDHLDFTYIDDLIQGVIRVIESERSIGETFNITYGSARSIQELIGILKRYFPDAGFVFKPKDRLMPDRGTLSIEKARRILGYAPRYALEEGFERYIRWYRQFYSRSDGRFVHR